MNAEVKKWGNSLAVRLPRDLAQSLQLQDGSPVELELENGTLVIRPQRPARRRGGPNLDELLLDVTPDTVHAATDWGEPVGGEVW